MKKLILDPCCGGKGFWFNNGDKRVLFLDHREEAKGFVSARPNYEVKPDKIMDFRDLKLPDKTFKIVVFDPPHLTTLGKNSWMAKKYGRLDKKTWRDDLKKGFDECWRVLEDYGILIFKWNEYEINTNELIRLFEKDPLFGHTTCNKGKTKWFTYMKLPEPS